MKKTIIIIMFGLIYSSVHTQEPALKQAPLNPEYIKYMEALEKGEINTYTSDGHSLGYIPSPVKYKPTVPANLQKNMDLPTVYDLRTQGKVTPVKDQGTCGSCWAFASIGAIESRWLVLGIGTYNLSEQNLKNGHGFSSTPCAGGNASYATSYFIRGSGPVSETDNPYNISIDTYVSGLTPQGYITDARFLPNEKNVLKQIIYNNGAIFSNMYFDYAYYKEANKTYYFNGTSTTNHAILLIGWDDNINTDGGTGAWIVKNSYGTAFGDNGYFYISYNDTKVNSDLAYWPNRIDYNPNATIHYYDKLGAQGYFGYTGADDYGLVKFIPSQNQQITKVGTWIHASNTTVNFTIYNNFNGNTLTSPLGSIENQTCDYPGYYTFDLTSPITINNGNDFYVKVKYTAPGEDFPIPNERVTPDANPDIETEKCWISYNGSTWTSIGKDTPYEMDLCIKAYGIPQGTPVETTDEKIPEQFALHQNYPNPFNPGTTIKYDLPGNQHVTLKVYDISGREVIKLVDQDQEAGYHQVNFDAHNLPSGIYICQMIAGDYTQTMKVTLLK